MTLASGGGRAVWTAVVAVASAVFLTTAAAAGDPRLSVEQVPEERARGREARDEGLLEERVPERCRDPEVAASDPACVEARRRGRDGERGEIPIIEAPGSDERTKIVPGVTINQPRPPRTSR
ncbi:MAG: hypothetical protein GVY33_08080 [Alphaproteobacteria bacterium]|jgi:hypothetical protein|nr:hypothetical protein [Alphaproteobacteria bacterium]